MRLEPGQLKALAILTRYLDAKGIRSVVIGAMVPVLLIDGRTGDGGHSGSRITRDIDLSLRLSGWDEFHRVKRDLCGLGFTMKRGNPEHRLTFQGFDIDIIPFDPDLSGDGFLTWPESGKRMNMRGFGLVFDQTETVSLESGITLAVVKIPMAVLLKINAWTDRREIRDLEDILFMLNHYEDQETGERRFDVSGESGLTYECAGAFLAGRDLAGMAIPELHSIVAPLFGMFEDPDSAIAHTLYFRSHLTVEHVFDLMRFFKKGIELSE